MSGNTGLSTPRRAYRARPAAAAEDMDNWHGVDGALFAMLALILVGVLWLISQAAWTGSVQLGQGTFFPALGTGLLGAVINPSNASSRSKPKKSRLDRLKDACWRGLVLLSTAACVATGWAVWDHRADAAYSSSFSVPALVAALGALAGVYANLASITKRPA